MNKLIFTFIVLLFLNNCSFNENSRIWKDKENKLETDKKITKVFSEDKASVKEFNQDLKLDLSSIKIVNKKKDNQNNIGLQNYKGDLKKIGSFKFSKLSEINQLGFEPKYTVRDGIEELISAFELGLYKDSLTSPDEYGNYNLVYKE